MKKGTDAVHAASGRDHHGLAGRRRVILAGAAALLLLGGATAVVWRKAPARPLPALQTERYLVGAHYYIWYPRNFAQGYLRGRLAPPQTFAAGDYRLDNPAVLERQIAWCSQYGIDFLTIDWWPDREKEQKVFVDAFYKARNIGDIRFCVFYETWGLGFDRIPGATRFDKGKTDRLIADFGRIADRCFGHPSYLRIGGRPVVVLYLTRTFTGEFEAAIGRLRAAMRERGHDVFLIGDEIFWKVSPVPLAGRAETPLVEAPQTRRIQLFDAITSYNMYEGGTTSHAGYASQSRYVEDVADKYEQYIKAAGGRVYVAPQIIPGYNDRGTRLAADHFAIPRQWEAGSGDGTLLAELFDRHAFRFIDSRLNLLFITSWNEWNEDTAIEPLTAAPGTREDRSPSKSAYTQGYTYTGHATTYLEVVRDKVVSVAGRVTDGAGRGVASVQVAARGERGAPASTRTDFHGFYRFSRLTLPPGPYVVSADGSREPGKAVRVGPSGCVCGVDFALPGD